MKITSNIIMALLLWCGLAASFARAEGPPPLAANPAAAPIAAPATTLAPAPVQPIIELPAEAPRELSGTAPDEVRREPSFALPRESPVENPLGRAPAIRGSAFGGYGELTFNKVEHTPAILDLRRFVLYFGHNFTDSLRFYSEVEVEHAISSSTDAGEIEIEQAYLDGLIHRRVNLRGGLILVPVGIVNIYHEPPIFNGVDRPLVDTAVIPTTWREAGFGIFGELAEGLRYQLYVVNGFNANGFTAELAIREGHQEGQLARAADFGGVARVDYEPRLGTDIGASFYSATSGNTLTDAVGKVPVTIAEIDARTQLGGFTARAEFAALFIGDAAPLNTALMAAGNAEGPVSAQSRGGYAEVGYDLLRLLQPAIEHSLTLFGRYDYVDTQASVPSGFAARPVFRRQGITLGLVYRPILQIALKLDYQRLFFGEGPSANGLASAITWMF